jgi:hypothetical protein
MSQTALYGRVTLSVLCVTAFGFAEEPSTAEKERSQRQLRLMKQAIAEFKVEPEMKFASDPILRYSDPVRELLDASVWRLGEEGRPKAIVTVELYRRPNNVGLLTYEFTLVADERISLRSTRTLESSRQLAWAPPVSKPEFKTIADAPTPAEARPRRLVQMKELIRRFKVVEFFNMMQAECRLMPQPIDRYDDKDAKIVDGAVFAFAHGTNPEIAVSLETDGKGWRYHVIRLTSAGAKVDLDGQTVYEADHIRSYQPNQPYSSDGHPVELP